jgi:outer membrane protein OmpA-like peptidoglycan-associated protein
VDAKGAKVREGFGKRQDEFMKRLNMIMLLAAGLLVISSAEAGQQASDVVTKSARAVGYQVGGGSTKVDLRGTDLLPAAVGEAKVEARQGATAVEVNCKKLASPTRFGAEFLTFVLWAVSPEGRTVNLGELLVDQNGDGYRKTSTPMQMFSLIVTAEPYFAVRLPSELVVLENEVRKDTKGKIFIVDNYRLMKKAQYQMKANPLALTMDLKNVPLGMYEARNAFEIATANQAEKYAPEIFTKAEASLKMAENSLARKAASQEVISTAVQSIQFSEDARALAIQRQAEEALANERKAADDAQRQARERADQEARQRAEAEAAKAQALLQEQQAKQKAEEAARQKAEADAARAQAEVERLRAESERQAALQKEETARKAAEDAERARKQAEEEKAQLRAKLLQQFSQVLDTRDTDRGLVVNMSDVLFDTGKYTLRQEAREKLARIAGIVLNYPGLRLEAEGHTDNVGTAEFNQKLSEQRADSVRGYLIAQGIPESSITSSGKGFTVPVTPNDTAAGRQKNRRVELIVSGEVIGTSIGKVVP